MNEPKELNAEELSGAGWEEKTDGGEWVTVPNAEHVSSATGASVSAPPNGVATPLQGTPNASNSTHAKLWSGEIYQNAQTIFDSTFDADLLEEFSSRAPSFQMLTGRFDPFSVERLRPLLEGGQYSTFITRQIITFRDALEHAFKLSQFWREEDDSVVVLTQEQKEQQLAHHPVIDEADPADACELAKIAWKDAVRQRAEAMEQWDAYVAEYRLRYQIEKRQMKKK